MRWTAKHLRQIPEANSVRLFIRFAWFPVYISGIFIWFEGYEVLKVYQIVDEKVKIDDEFIIFSVGKWVNLAKKCK